MNSETKTPEITPYTSQTPYSPLTGVKRGYINLFVAESWFGLIRVGDGFAVYRSETGYAGRTVPFSISVICNIIWRLHAADAAFEG